MYKVCKTEATAQRQKEIEQRLLSLMLSKKYDEITVSELCEELEMPRKAFYRYFDGKDDCLRALIDHTFLEYWKLEDENGRKHGKRDLLMELEAFFIFWKAKRTLLEALDKSDMLGIVIETSVGSSSNAQNVAKFLPGEPDWMRTQIYQFSICGLMFAMIGWYRSGFKSSTAEMAGAAVRMLSKPLFPDLDKLGFK